MRAHTHTHTSLQDFEAPTSPWFCAAANESPRAARHHGERPLESSALAEHRHQRTALGGGARFPMCNRLHLWDCLARAQHDFRMDLQSDTDATTLRNPPPRPPPLHRPRALPRHQYAHPARLAASNARLAARSFYALQLNGGMRPRHECCHSEVV